MGIIVITAIGLISWLVNNYETSSNIKIVSDVVAVFVLTISIIIIDKKIKNKIRSLKEL